MRAVLCWSCWRLCECEKAFPNGRPKKQSDCREYKVAPRDSHLLTHREIAELLNFKAKKVDRICASVGGANYLVSALAQKGIEVICKKRKNRIYFYKKETLGGDV